MPERWPEDPWRRRGVWLVYGLLAVAALVVLGRNLGRPEDFRNFVPFGIAGLAGQNPYDPTMVAVYGHQQLWSTWPPSFGPIAAFLAQLVAAVGRPLAVLLWQGANLLALSLMLAYCARWLYGRRLTLAPGPGRLPLYTLPALVGLLVPSRLVFSNFQHSQTNLLFMGLAVAAFWLFRRGRRWGGGLAMGLATAFKATPVVLLPYLAWRGRWRDLGASVGGCVVAWLVLPVLLLGPETTVEWYRGWAGFVGELNLPLASENLSLQGTLSRLMADPDAVVIGEVAPHATVGGALGAYGAEWVVLALMGVLGAGAAVAFGRPGRAVGRRREALELGVALTALGLFSPIGWKYHFVGLVVLTAALYARTRPGLAYAPQDGGAEPDRSGIGVDQAGTGVDLTGPERRVIGLALLVSFLVVSGTSSGVIGQAASDLFEHYGAVTWPSLALVVIALWCLWRERTGDA